MTETPSAEKLASRLNRLADRGRSARRKLGKHLIKLPASEIAKLPRGILARLGPDGVRAALEAVSKQYRNELKDAERPGATFVASEPEQKNAPAWLVAITAIVVICSAAIVIDCADRPVKWAISEMGWMTPEASGLCHRHDSWAKKCSSPNFLNTTPLWGF